MLSIVILIFVISSLSGNLGVEEGAGGNGAAGVIVGTGVGIGVGVCAGAGTEDGAGVGGNAGACVGVFVDVGDGTAEGSGADVVSGVGASEFATTKLLSVQALNDTNTTEDREKIQSEIDQLKSEIDSIANSTNFNTIPLLNVYGKNIITNDDIEQKIAPVFPTDPNGDTIAMGTLTFNNVAPSTTQSDTITLTAGQSLYIYVESFSHIDGAAWPDLNLVAPNGDKLGYSYTYVNSSSPSNGVTGMA